MRYIPATEEQEQSAVIEYCDLKKIPVVHVPNEGKRSIAYGAKLKKIGMRKGFPDLFIPVAKHGYHGLFIEMKDATGKKTATPEQLKWINILVSNGYYACVRHGAQEAINEINAYMS